MAESPSFRVTLEQQQDFEFNLRFDWGGVSDLMLDTGAPLGRSAGPDAERILAGAVGYCLTASLLFCLRKFKQAPGKLRADVIGTLARNERGRLRVGRLDARIHLSDAVADIKHFDRCAQQFEDFCVVSDSVRHGIPIDVEIFDARGQCVYGARSREGDGRG